MAAAAVFVLALLLRLRGLGETFVVNDEIMQFHEALGPAGWRAFFEALARNPHHLLLDPLTTRLAAALSPSTAAMRLPSALWGAGAAWLLCRLGAREKRPGLGLAAGLSLAINPLHWDWSRRADFYALLSFISVWSVYEYLFVLDEKRRWRRLALANAVFLLSHPYAVFMGAFQILFVVRRREPLISVLKAWACAAAVYLPWFLFSTRALLDASTFDFRANAVVPSLSGFLLGLPAALALAPEAGLASPLAPLAAAALGVGWLVSLAALRRERPRMLLLSHALLVFGSAATLGADLFYRYYFSPRQWLWLTPFLLLVAADGWSRLLKPRPARLAALGLCALASLTAILRAQAWQKERADGMAALVEEVARLAPDGGTVRFENDQLLAGFLYHYDLDSFRRIAGMRLIKGMMSYEFPEGRWVRRDGKELAFVTNPACGPGEGLAVCGDLYSTTVYRP